MRERIIYMKRILAIVLLFNLLLTLLGCEMSIDPNEGIIEGGLIRGNCVTEISDAEFELRMSFVAEAEKWLGANSLDGSHKPILTIYNNHTPLAQGYMVKETDKWCATFVSAIAISMDLTDIIPTECGCQRQIGLFDDLGCWEERDDYMPLPGDIIFYCTGNKLFGDCIGWSDHVGIVVGTRFGWIQVIEGNVNDTVTYRYIMVNDLSIRGFGIPNFSSKV